MWFISKPILRGSTIISLLLYMADPTSNTATGPERTIPPSPCRLLNNGIRNQSTAEIAYALQLDRSLLSSALFTAVFKGSVALTAYLITTEHAPVDKLTPLTLAIEPSVELLDVVVSAGWNLNQRNPDRGAGKGHRLIDLVAGNECLVKWCLEHGSQISDGAEDEDPLKYPPLTESVAALGTVSIFKLLRANDARIGRRTLHRAAKSAATCDAADKAERMAMVKFLVEEEGLDVNKIDTDRQLPNHWGTPVAYAAKGKGGEDVVRYLLAKGADPRVMDCWGNHNALSLAEFYGNKDVARVLREWRMGEEKSEGRWRINQRGRDWSLQQSSHPLAHSPKYTSWSSPTPNAYMLTLTSNLYKCTSGKVFGLLQFACFLGNFFS